MRNAILVLAFLPAVTFGQALNQSDLKALENANGVKYAGGLSNAFTSNQDKGLNWFKNKAFELDKEFTIRMCGDDLCYIRESNGPTLIAVEQEEGDFNGRKLQGQLVRVIGTDIYGTMIITRLNLHKKRVNQIAIQPSPNPVKPDYPNLTDNFDELIKARSAEGWARPPSTKKEMVVELEISMTPDGTVTSVSVVSTSGDTPFDKSAVAAVKNIGRLTEMQTMKPSDINRYRSFKMRFTPNDLSL
ncbi:cell envelope integrity protein TolA [Pseudomonas sp. PDM01]|nr:cell envelope integrity protein TolA [Pseudomonas sp. PDM01]